VGVLEMRDEVKTLKATEAYGSVAASLVRVRLAFKPREQVLEAEGVGGVVELYKAVALEENVVGHLAVIVVDLLSCGIVGIGGEHESFRATVIRIFWVRMRVVVDEILRWYEHLV